MRIYYWFHFNEKRFIPCVGVPVEIPTCPSVEFFAREEMDLIIVSEVRTGIKASEGRSLSHATSEAVERCTGYGEQGVRDNMESYIRRFGEAPKPIEVDAPEPVMT